MRKEIFSKIDLLEAEIKYIEKKIKEQQLLDLKLEEALKKLDWEKAKSLILTGGANVNGKDSNGIPFLFYPIKVNNVELFKFFLEHGAKVNIRDKHKNTPLMIACKIYSSIDFVDILLENYADPTLKNYKGRTALSFLGSLKPDKMKAKLIKNKLALYEEK